MVDSIKHTDLDDVMGAISDLATLMDKRFEGVDARLDGIDARLDGIDARLDGIDARLDGIDAEIHKVHKEQTEMREWLEHIDGRLLGIESDIKEIYDRIVVLEKKAPNLTKREQAELSRKFESMLEWAKLVSEKTGVALPKF